MNLKQLKSLITEAVDNRLSEQEEPTSAVIADAIGRNHETIGKLSNWLKDPYVQLDESSMQLLKNAVTHIFKSNEVLKKLHARMESEDNRTEFGE